PPRYYSKYYKGMFRDMHLFVDEGVSRFILTELGEIQYSYSIERDVRSDILPLWVLHDEIDQESHLSSLEGEILRGTHFYYVGYEGRNNHLMVVDIDLDKMFPEAKDWIKKKMN
ncbi:MAG TPA: hypothetical protein H9818_08870, partial [Candidatus Phocaeicola gallistercoris]|nr:hypothetical protein [Candidatus Phocaeicola gallistercoris]